MGQFGISERNKIAFLFYQINACAEVAHLCKGFLAAADLNEIKFLNHPLYKFFIRAHLGYADLEAYRLDEHTKMTLDCFFQELVDIVNRAKFLDAPNTHLD